MSDRDTEAAAALKALEEFREWCKQHSPAEIAAHIAQMPPEERLQFRAHITAMRDVLKGYLTALPKA